jgi:two-component system NtrC family sensor kinase
MQINKVLRKTIALRSYDLSNHGIEVVEELDESLPELIADSQQIQQVFLNILNNAYDAVRNTGRPGRIEIQTGRTGDWVEIKFSDNGEGIRYPERIFDPFFTTKEVGQGTGLGLSICYGIVREHEGEILCSNNSEGPGACFSVRLPFQAKPNRNLVATVGAKL